MAQLNRLEKTWSDLSQSRLDWAFDAYGRFIDSLSPDIQEYLPKGDERGAAYVVVYGSTQVGKTTLILDLMGISGGSFARVSNVLRGGREEGKSATATAMEYRRSNDEFWWLASGIATEQDAPKQHNDASMTAALRSIRDQMSNKRLQASKPFIVCIPNDCFGDDKNGVISARMLDLPGIQAADVVERKYVKQMAQQYVPNADLILLVGKGDGLTFLDPSALELPSIEDWQVVPKRFRIVTTYSFTAASVSGDIRHMTAVSADFFRQRLLNQIGTFGLKLDEEAADPCRFFPLEFGDSWIAAKPDLVAKLEPVISELKAQLQRDIQSAANPIQRLRNAIDVHVTVAKIKERHLKQMDEELKWWEREKNEILNDYRTLLKAYESVKIEINRKMLELPPLDRVTQHVKSAVVFDIRSMVDEARNLNTDTSLFKSLIRKFSADLKAQFLNMLSKVTLVEDKKFWVSINPRLDQHLNTLNEKIEAEFAQLRGKLSGYWSTEYYPSLSSDWQDDRKSMCIHMENCHREVRAWTVTLWQEWVKNRHQEIKNKLDAKQAALNDLVKAKTERLKALTGIDILIDHATKKRSDFLEKFEADITKSRKFVDLLELSYLSELRYRRENLMEASNAADAFVRLLAVDQLINERNKLLVNLS
jgi:hypothetical protein